MNFELASRRSRLAALGVAGLLAALGLWLAVTAGASRGASARDAAYPTTYYYKAVIDKHPPKRTHSRRATFKFHIAPHADPGLSLACKLDGKAFGYCKSPHTYKHLKPGKHKFQVMVAWIQCKPLAAGSNCAASAPAKYGWTVK